MTSILSKISECLKSERSVHPYFFLSKKERERIVAAIREAEIKTSGEIRVHLQHKIKSDIMVHGKEVFEKLGMARTEHHNGVLIFIGTKCRRFALLADKGIHQHLEQQFWDALAAKMENHFKQNRFADGIVEAVLAIGGHLKTHFPHARNDVNELPDKISMGM